MGKQEDAFKYEVNRSNRNPTDENNSIWVEVEEIEEEVEEEEEEVEEEEEEEEVEEEEEEEEVEEEVEEEEEVVEEEEEVEEYEEEEEVEEVEEEEEEEVEEVEEEEEEMVEEKVEEEEEKFEEEVEEVEEEEEEEVDEDEEEEPGDELGHVDLVEVPQKVKFCAYLGEQRNIIYSREEEQYEHDKQFEKEPIEDYSSDEPKRISEAHSFEGEVTEAYGQQKLVQVEEVKEEPEEEEYEEEEAFKEPEKKLGCCTKIYADSSTKMVNQKQPDFQESSSKKRRSKWDVKEEAVEKSESELSRKKKSKRSVIDSQINPPGELNEDCKVDETFKEPKERLGGCIDFDADSCHKMVDKKHPGLEGSRSKKRRSKWDMKEKGDNQSDECSDLSGKRRKSRWSDIDSQFRSPVGETDTEIANLYVQLLDINEKMRSGLIGGDEHVKLKQSILSKIFQKKFDLPMQLNFPKPPTAKYSKKLYIPVEEFPEYNFVGLILGPCGNTQKKMEAESGASIKLRGRDSGCKDKRTSKSLPDSNEDLHVFIEADSKHSLDTAVAMVEKLLIPVDDAENKHKLNQLIELAEIRGTRRGGNCSEKKLSTPNDDGKKEHIPNQFNDISKSKGMLLGRKCAVKHDPCDVCGSASHPTSKCLLIAQTPQANSNAIPVSTSMKLKKEIDYANLFIGFLPKTVDDSKLIELFNPFGPLSQVKVMKDKTMDVSKGYGFVRYTNPISAAKAITHMNGYQIEGKKLAVRIAGIPETEHQLAPLPCYPTPASAVQNSSNVLHWPGPPESRPNPTSWPPPPESMPNPTSWPPLPESKLQNIATSTDPMYGPGSSDWWSKNATMVQQNSIQTSWASPLDPLVPSTAVSSFTSSSSLPQYSGSFGCPFQSTTSSSLLSSNSGASSSFQSNTSGSMLYSDSRASDELASFPGYLKSLGFSPTLERQSTTSKDLPSSVFYDLPLSSRSSYSSMFGNSQSFDLPPVFSDLPVSSRSPYSSMLGGSQTFGSYHMPPN